MGNGVLTGEYLSLLKTCICRVRFRASSSRVKSSYINSGCTPYDIEDTALGVSLPKIIL